MIRSFRVVFSKTLQYKFCSTATPKVKKFDIPLLQKLSSEFGDVTLIAENIHRDEKLLKIPFLEWKSRIELLKSFQLKDDECFRMIFQYPSLLETPMATLEDSIRTWSNCPFQVPDFYLLLLSTPEVLDVDSNEIRRRVPYLVSLYKVPKSVVTLLQNCPNVMFDDWQSTLDKINYLLEVKGVERREILQSKALTRTLEFIKLRFEVLEKTGVYKKPIMHAHKKNDRKIAKHKNPHLKLITDPNDVMFSKTVANITTEEFQVYKDLFENNRSEENKLDNDDDEEEEEE